MAGIQDREFIRDLRQITAFCPAVPPVFCVAAVNELMLLMTDLVVFGRKKIALLRLENDFLWPFLKERRILRTHFGVTTAN